jgi:exodeoxyribonuclease-3
MSMRVMTWNLLKGGQDSGSCGRLDRVVRVVRLQAPDIVLFQEASKFNTEGNRLLHELENAFDMHGYLALANTGYHLAAYVRRSEWVKHSHVDTEKYFHGLLGLDLVLNDSHLLVLDVHLCPHSPETRLWEARNLASYASNATQVLIAGDLNSLDPYDNHTDSLTQMPDHYRARYVLPGKENLPDTRVTRTLEDAGFVDLGHRLGKDDFTIPTKLPVYGSNFGKLRLDYVYATEPLASATTDVRVLRNDVTDQASDHYPIVVDFALTGSHADPQAATS